MLRRIKRKSEGTWDFWGKSKSRGQMLPLELEADLLPLPSPDALKSCEPSESHQLALP